MCSWFFTADTCEDAIRMAEGSCEANVAGYKRVTRVWSLGLLGHTIRYYAGCEYVEEYRDKKQWTVAVVTPDELIKGEREACAQEAMCMRIVLPEGHRGSEDIGTGIRIARRQIVDAIRARKGER